MAVLAWVKSKGVFIKVQEGIGDNLTREDRAEGFVDYALWSTFRPECLDLDGELTMECLDSGMTLFRRPHSARAALPACCRAAFAHAVRATVLMED